MTLKYKQFPAPDKPVRNNGFGNNRCTCAKLYIYSGRVPSDCLMSPQYFGKEGQRSKELKASLPSISLSKT